MSKLSAHFPMHAENLFRIDQIAGNVFSRFYQDIESHHVFCRLAERKILSENLTISSNQRWGVNLPGPCVDGWNCMENSEKSSISLQLIKEMWNTYRDTPK